jgi:hypothetical protein
MVALMQPSMTHVYRVSVMTCLYFAVLLNVWAISSYLRSIRRLHCSILYISCTMCSLCTCRRQWQAHDGTVHADEQNIIELSSCMLRIQAAFTIEMGGVRGVDVTTTASTTTTNAIHGVLQ